MKLICQKQCITETAVSSLTTLCKENQMRLNYNKTHLMNIKENSMASIDNHKLDQVKNQRDLVVQVSENLNWNENCSFRKRKVSVLFSSLKEIFLKRLNKNLN